MAGDDEKVLPWDAFDGEKRIRATVDREFPDLKFGFYHWTGEWIVGALEDFANGRILLFIPCPDQGGGTFVRNGQALELPLKNPVTLRTAHQGVTADGTVSSSDDAYDYKIGYWIKLEATDRFEISVALRFPNKGRFHATYDPDNGWQTSCVFEVADQNRREPADAYEITRSSLLKRVLDVLRAKDECIVRLHSNQCHRVNIAVRKWAPRDATEIEPLELALLDGIAIGSGDSRRDVSLRELERDLDLFSSAARSAQARAAVRIRVRDGTDDKVFRATLTALAQENPFLHVYLITDAKRGAAGQQARIGEDLSFTLPDGCIHKPARGLDSLPGHIYARGSKFEIHYDVGDPGAGLSRIKEWKAQKLETKRISLPANLGEGFLRVIDADRKWVVFATTSDIVFEAELKDDGDLAVFSAIVSSLRKVQPQPPQNPEAERGATGQPATRHESESEGGDKPQPDSEGRSR